ncbi:hypothetical protein KA005_79010, partial [bacterium]|nr:hypothetical protein [bacterium]
SWLLLDSYYFVTLLPLTERRIFNRTPLGWIKRSFAPFIFIGVALFLTGKVVLTLTGLDTLLSLFIGGGSMTIAYLLIGYRFLDPSVQGMIRSLPELIGELVPSSRKASS